ncbi:hypothetical protein AWB77_04495 [Caballeronia fortuita]|uniref:DUF1330 domain-containing protein n=1 Tax=Caballeronia fortuita TaxID=1777138 RepID=A0A158CTH2_9BURK|nr:DUF1330 domain-containing protein [Caballeronia fortuita]SAK85500.1 hypothetical protein AWB77_04495 [Caballeronia fortuita]
MSAYVVMIREGVNDTEKLKSYGELAKKAREGHAIESLVFYGEEVFLEGKENEGCVILKFPSISAAKDWYYSPAYQDALRLRKLAASYQVFIVKGVAT